MSDPAGHRPSRDHDRDAGLMVWYWLPVIGARSAWPSFSSGGDGFLANGLPKPHPWAGLVGWDQQRPAPLQGRYDLGCRRGVEVMSPVLEVTDGAARDIRPFGELLLGPVQKATGGTALFGRQLRHSGCSCMGNVKSPITVEPRALS